MQGILHTDLNEIRRQFVEVGDSQGERMKATERTRTGNKKHVQRFQAQIMLLQRTVPSRDLTSTTKSRGVSMHVDPTMMSLPHSAARLFSAWNCKNHAHKYRTATQSRHNARLVTGVSHTSSWVSPPMINTTMRPVYKRTGKQTETQTTIQLCA